MTKSSDMPQPCADGCIHAADRIGSLMPKCAFFALLMLLGSAGALPAQGTWTWISPVAGAWGMATNWDKGTVPNATDAVVVFSNSPPAVWTTNVISGGTNTPFTFGAIISSNGMVLDQSGSGVELIAAVSTGVPVINVVNSGSLWLYPLLGGTQGFNKTGAGEVTFRYNGNNNPLTGNVIISGGDLCLNLDVNLGNVNNGLVISNNARLLINPTTLAPVTLAPTRTLTLACAAANLDVAGTNWLTIPGVINESAPGQGGLEKTDLGTLALSGPNTYSGGTTVSGGVLNCQTNRALGTGPATVNSGGELACGADDQLAAGRPEHQQPARAVQRQILAGRRLARGGQQHELWGQFRVRPGWQFGHAPRCRFCVE